ncbi:hypothetical protein [Pseudochryseolinea flava]|uniref:HTTM domain-containing protein n=1 Tax=Pseudochryseolinea flava TaxID=2059302 RepID=A0A364Y9A8_9BACT|nr:hypothetical protein [Pseudochryseolinea flava]RAW03473.1 hypothetical protein DQQ10_05155 [Pseudochryseolinea flava]
MTTATIVDGGDQVVTVLTLLLIPICLLDRRRNHWHVNTYQHNASLRLVAYSTLVVIKIQVAYIYFQACVSKFSVSEWADGTAVYYWFLNPMFGVTTDTQPIFVWVLSKPVPVTVLTWGALFVEFLIFAVFTLKENHPLKRYVFLLGIAFHFVIMLIHGLVSFFFSMAGALIIYLLPSHTTMPFKRDSTSKVKHDEWS